jgi:hypothetical protein
LTDTDPKFFTFNSLSNFGKETYLKLTNVDYTQTLDTDAKGEWSYERALKRELALDTYFDSVLNMVMDGKNNKAEIRHATITKHPAMNH